jgi:hypothetical protein
MQRDGSNSLVIDRFDFTAHDPFNLRQCAGQGGFCAGDLYLVDVHQVVEVGFFTRSTETSWRLRGSWRSRSR